MSCGSGRRRRDGLDEVGVGLVPAAHFLRGRGVRGREDPESAGTFGAVLPYTGHLAHILSFQPMPGRFFLALAGIVVVYLVLAETGKHWFYRPDHAPGV